MACPFLIKEEAAHFSVIWTSQKNNWVQFLKTNESDDGYGTLGDVINLGHKTTVAATFAPAPDFSKSLAHPLDFVWILDDAGSGNPDDLDYWWPVAPRDYVAMGICFGDKIKPNPKNYWCVHKSFCTESLDAEPYWSDEGQGWKHHNGNLLMPGKALDPPEPPNQRLPQTLLSEEAMQTGHGRAMVLTWE